MKKTVSTPKNKNRTNEYEMFKNMRKRKGGGNNKELKQLRSSQ
jgi:hypothetical protein